MKKIVISGGSGFIGRALVSDLASIADVVVLSRNPSKVAGVRAVRWSPDSEAGEWTTEVATADAVINLAGANMGEGRWTHARKQELVDSRVESTRAIVDVLRRSQRERVLVSASAVGYYGDRGEDILDESSTPGADFVASLAQRWEAEARRVEGAARLVILRFGIVLDRAGGALAKTLTPFRFGVGGVLGNGRQYWSWIDLIDAVRMVRWAIENPNVEGVYDATAPEPVTNREFTRELATALRRPAIIPAPAFALRIVFGEMADALLLRGQRAIPARAVSEGFEFEYPDLPASFGRSLSGTRTKS